MPGQKRALIIGVNGAPKADLIRPLTAPEQAAPALAAVLVAPVCGFTIASGAPLLGSQATAPDIQDAILECLEDLGPDDTLLISWCGHGIPVSLDSGVGDIFLMTYDFHPTRVKRNPDRYLSMRWLREKVLLSPVVGRIVLLLDCCYAGGIGATQPLPRIDDLRTELKTLLDVGQTTPDLQETKVARSALSRVVLTATLPWTPAKARLRRTIFSRALLKGLMGAPIALRSDGTVTVDSLREYIFQQTSTLQACGRYGMDNDLIVLARHTPPIESERRQIHEQQQQQQQHRDHHRIEQAAQHVESERILALRLKGFVGRNMERTKIQEAIEQIRPTGGYVVIKADAGEGKSSIIAKLIDEAGIAATPHHFIALMPGQDYQLSLLRTVIAQLILKHKFDMGSFPDESYPLMKDLFALVLHTIAVLGHQETIYLDGLDQLEPELSGVRDLSFLPPQLSSGIVIVLGTRPDDTLRPLEPLHKVEYDLPHFTQPDFIALLQNRAVQLPPTEVTNLYAALDGNVLYLTLAVNELRRTTSADIAGLVHTITADPGSLFSITLDRIKRSDRILWNRVVKPILGVLMVTQEPLAGSLLRSLLKIDHDDLTDGLRRLGGLVSQNSNGAYFLYHLKFRDYLAEPASDLPPRPSLFAQEDVIDWHHHLATWCLPDDAAVETIWQPGTSDLEERRRHYARQYAILHLAEGQQYDRMWSILKDGRYGRHKRRFDPSTQLYALDLNRARDVAFAMHDLTALWRWSLLRVSLTSQIDQWPDALFLALVHLGRGSEALSRVELLSDSRRKATILGTLAPFFDSATAQRVWDGAVVAATTIDDTATRADTLRALAQALAQAQHPDATVTFALAATTAAAITHDWTRDNSLSALVQAMAQAQRWDNAQTTLAAISHDRPRNGALAILAEAMAQAQRWDEAQSITAAITDPETRAYVLRALVVAMAQAQCWDAAQSIAASIAHDQIRVVALSVLALTMAQAQHPHATATFALATANATIITDIEARAVALSTLAHAQILAQHPDATTTFDLATSAAAISDPQTRAAVLSDVALAMGKTDRWDEAQTIADNITDDWTRAITFNVLADAMAQAQHPEAATTFVRATTAAAAIINDQERTGALRALAQAQAQAGQWRIAQATAITITDDGDRARALSALAEAMAQAHHWDEAQTTAATITDDGERARALSALAQALAQAQHPDAAATFILATPSAITLHDDHTRAGALSTLAQAMAHAGNWEEARITAATISDDRLCAEALRTLTQAMAHEGNWKEARITAAAISDDWLRAEALRTLAQALARVQHPDADDTFALATSTAAIIPDDGKRARTLHDMVQVMAQAQRWEAAITTVATISDIWMRFDALRDMAETQVQTQHPDAATTAALAATTADAISNDDARAAALRTLVQALAQAHRWHEAQTTAIAITHDQTRAFTLRDLAQALAQVHRWDEAHTTAAAITDDRVRAFTLRDLTAALAQAHRWEEAHTTAAAITDPEPRTVTLSALAGTMAQAQHPDTNATFAIAITTAAAIVIVETRAIVLRDLAGAMAQVQHPDANATFALATTTAASISNDDARAASLRALVEVMAQAHRWDEAHTTAATITHDEERAYALRTLVIAQAQAQRWDEAQTTATAITDEDARAETLRGLAQVMTQAHHWKEAQTTIAAISDTRMRAETLRILALTMTEAHHPDADATFALATTTAGAIAYDGARTIALRDLAQAMAQVQRWEEAQTAAAAITDEGIRAETLRNLYDSLLDVGNTLAVRQGIGTAWRAATTRDTLLTLAKVAHPLFGHDTALGREMVTAFAWVDSQIRDI